MSDERITVPMLAEDGSNWVNDAAPTPRYVTAGDVDGRTPQMRWDDDEVLARMI